jgi:hypothetical protein
VTNTEIAFFGLAFLLPLVGGGTLLYLLSRGGKKTGDEGPKRPE